MSTKVSTALMDIFMRAALEYKPAPKPTPFEVTNDGKVKLKFDSIRIKADRVEFLFNGLVLAWQNAPSNLDFSRGDTLTITGIEGSQVMKINS